MTTIIKKLQVGHEAEVGNIVRLLLSHKFQK